MLLPAVALVVLSASPDTVLVARHDLARGHALTAADVDTVVVETRLAPGDAARAEPGWITRRVVRAGEPLRAPALEPPPLVLSGAAVTLVWETNGLRVTRQGTALGDARRGDRVAVRVDARRRFTGVVTARGVVTVTSR